MCGELTLAACTSYQQELKSAGGGGSLSLAGFAYPPRFQMSIGDVHHHRGCPRVVLTPAYTSIGAYTFRRHI
eukprot:7526042-Pyramimonas_sp.AAC.1